MGQKTENRKQKHSELKQYLKFKRLKSRRPLSWKLFLNRSIEPHFLMTVHKLM